MTLWLLRPIEGLPRGDDPWEPWFDKAFGFVVRADSEDQARAFAQADAGDEKRDKKAPWLDPKYSTCEPLLSDGEAGVVIQDFAAA